MFLCRGFGKHFDCLAQQPVLADRDFCGCPGDWTAGNIVSDAIAQVRDKVGKDKVLLGLSGGVDSSVVAALLARAIGEALSDRTGLRARGNLARKKAMERYSLSGTLSALTSLYRMKTKEAT